MEEIRNDEIEEIFDFEEEVEEVKEKKGVINKIKDLGGAAVDKIKDGIDYVKEHPDEAAEKATVGLGALLLGGIALSTAHNVREAERTVYAPEIDETVKLKRKLTNSDKVELDYRVHEGKQSKVEALNDMNLIK